MTEINECFNPTLSFRHFVILQMNLFFKKKGTRDSRLSTLRAFERQLINAVLLFRHAIRTGWLCCIAADLTLPARNTCLFAGVAIRFFSILPCSLSIPCRLGFRGFPLSSAGRRRSGCRGRRHEKKTQFHYLEE